MVFFSFILFPVLSVLSLGDVREGHPRLRDLRNNDVEAFQSHNIGKNQNGCAEFGYWRNGELQWCGHNLNIFNATVSGGKRNLYSIISQLPNGQLSASTKINNGSTFETRIAYNITFGFETGTRSLVTA